MSKRWYDFGLKDVFKTNLLPFAKPSWDLLMFFRIRHPLTPHKPTVFFLPVSELWEQNLYKVGVTDVGNQN